MRCPTVVVGFVHLQTRTSNREHYVPPGSFMPEKGVAGFCQKSARSLFAASRAHLFISHTTCVTLSAKERFLQFNTVSSEYGITLGMILLQ